MLFPLSEVPLYGFGKYLPPAFRTEVGNGELLEKLATPADRPSSRSALTAEVPLYSIKDRRESCLRFLEKKCLHPGPAAGHCGGVAHVFQRARNLLS